MTTETKQQREWHCHETAPVLGHKGFPTYRPLSMGLGDIETQDADGYKFVLPTIEVREIIVEMPIMSHPDTNHRVTDTTANEFVEYMQCLSYIREKLNGNTWPAAHEHTETCIRIPTKSPDIIKLWTLHHAGEFVGDAHLTFGTLPVKMSVNIEDELSSVYSNEWKQRSLEMDNETIAWDYANEWNYIVGKNGRLYSIDNGSDDYGWLNNFRANELTKSVLEAADDDA